MRRVFFAALFLASTVVDAGTLQLAWRHNSQDELITVTAEQGGILRQPLPADLATPLGSIWKLFIYAWLTDNRIAENPYRCTGQSTEEVYCCSVGQEISREQALLQSCGLYFAPERWHIDASDWRQYWQKRHAPTWVTSLNALQPATVVKVSSLLTALSVLPAQPEARKTLLNLMVQPTDEPLASRLGGRLRVKTWSWHRESDATQRQGGFAGWLTDGTPVWARGDGTSKTILARYAGAIDQALPTTRTVDAQACVESQLFVRYPIKAVLRSGDGQPVGEGRLQGRYRVLFRQGNEIEIVSQGELYLRHKHDQWHITAQLSREEYVARVLEREAKAKPAEAAKALAVVIRTYLQQQAGHSADCLYIEDSSSRQRVAPRPASAETRRIANWTEGLVLSGSPVQYHSSRMAENQLSWRHAVELAHQGMRYDVILAQVWPQATLSTWERVVSNCHAMPEAKAWLLRQQPLWGKKLDAEPGYAATTHFAVCQLQHAGTPWVDRDRRRIYIRHFKQLQDRLDLTHEYLHLAFNGYPSSLDESYIENLARHLLME
ncbi:TPA: DUF2300 domain-containing protein [Salmonella enterica]|nr:DUF2300 domain-containing protein [Salmonella enterica]